MMANKIHKVCKYAGSRYNRLHGNLLAQEDMVSNRSTLFRCQTNVAWMLMEHPSYCKPLLATPQRQHNNGQSNKSQTPSLSWQSNTGGALPSCILSFHENIGTDCFPQSIISMTLACHHHAAVT